jgi:putative flavoprotein involved in K+ transport
MESVLVIGAGPAGLAVGAALKDLGVSSLLVDRNRAVGDSWRAHYDRLHLHTTRAFSALPGMAIPREYGQWVSRDDVVRYLEAYARHHALPVRLGVGVEGIAREGNAWRVSTSDGALKAERVVVATGYNHTPFLPEWPGRAQFSGELIHASKYKNAGPFRGRDVLVVGAGNTGAEIAVDLVEGGARRVRLSIRTPPNIILRSVGGVPSQAIAIVLRNLPTGVVDPFVSVIQRLTIGDLSKYGLPPAPRGVYSQVVNDAQIPILDVGLIEMVKSGKVEVVKAVERFEGGEVVLADGARVAAEVVIAATGYQRGLEKLVGHLGVLDARGLPIVHGEVTHAKAPGLHFIGYTNPVSGNLRELAIDARRIARACKRAQAAA